jgi:hypothetical protein
MDTLVKFELIGFFIGYAVLALFILIFVHNATVKNSPMWKEKKRMDDKELIMPLDVFNKSLHVRYADFKNSTRLDHIPTKEEEIQVCADEMIEFIQGARKQDIDNAIEEYYDVKQAMENTLQLMGISKEQLINGEIKHYTKLKNRGWRFKE